MITPGWPTKDQPYSSPFIVRQYSSLKNHDIDVDLFHFQGNQNPINYIKAWMQIKKILRNTNYDIIHAQWGHSALLTLSSKIPLIITYRGMDLEGIVKENGKYSFMGKLLIFLSKITSKYAQEIIVVSKSLGDKLSRKDYHIIPSGIDLCSFTPIDKLTARKTLNLTLDKKIILFAASHNNARKRYSLAKQAVSILEKQIDCELIVCSDVPHEKVATFMNASDCLILTSLHEGSPNVIKEALACNLPIVSVPVGDVVVRKQQLTHFQICNPEPNELAKAIKLVLSNKSKNNSRDTILDLDENILTQKLIQIYRKIVLENQIIK